ncbi:sigma-70 family RNA polymerase sigma factor [bacterium]|nr:sigma-70 family RNA polymerase sigma factor [bacterium]
MPPFPDFARQLRPDAAGTDDTELLRRFADHRDEAAFELLVWRHGGMVLATCRRVLGRSADVDDAFQVTFLALARRAGSIRTAAALPGWLHRTARRAALRVKSAAVRRAERPAADAPEPAADPVTPDDLGPVLDEEIDRLPEKLRRAFVLCYLEGVTNEAAAVRLGCPKGTILSRLSRALELLRARLTRRGVVVPALLTLPVGAPPSAATAAGIARAAAAFAAGAAPPEVPVHVVTIAQGVLRTMRLTQLRPIGLVLALAVLAGAGLAAAVGRQPPADPPPPPPAAQPRPVATPAPAAPRRLAVDKHDCPDVQQAAFSPDGRVIAISGSKQANAAIEDVLTLWDTATGRHLHTFRGRDAGANGLCFSPDGTRLAQPVTDAGEVIVREVASGKELRRFAHEGVYATMFSPEGKYLATTGGVEEPRSTDVHVWDVAAGKRVFTPARVKGETYLWALFVPDGRLLVVTDTSRLRWWNPATGREDPPVTLAGEAGRYAVPARDGKWFVGTRPGRPTLFDGTTGRVVRTFGNDGDVFEFANFSDDARTVIATDKAGRVVVWETATGTQKATFTVPGADAAGNAPFIGSTPNGRHLLAQWSQSIDGGRDTVPWVAVYTPDGRLVRRERGLSDLEFDDAGRSVVAVTRIPSTDYAPPKYDVTVHDAAAWLAGGAKKE